MATPKTKTQLLDTVFQDSQLPGSITASDMRDLVESIPYLQPLGWEFRFDSNYDDSALPGSAMNLVDLTPQAITFSDNPGEDLSYPSSFPSLWNTTSQRLIIPATFSNGFGIVRFSCKARAANAASTHLELVIDVGNDPESLGGASSNVIYEDSSVFAKGNNIEQYFNWVVPFFGGSDFVANGAKFIIQSHGGSADVWQFTITSGAILIPNPAGEG